MNATTTNTQTIKSCSDCNCTYPIELFYSKRDFYKTCIICHNRCSDVGKAILNKMLITLNKAIELIPSYYNDDEDTVIDRDSASINYSVDVYIRIDENMAVEGRDGYHYYQYFTKDTWLKYRNSFIFVDDCQDSFIKGLIKRHFEYIHLTIKHSIGHRAVPDSVNKNVDKDIRVYIQQNCTRILHNNQFTSANMLLDQVAGQGIMK
ncbi:hypothetical protein BDA99DRAFT_529123, partial [Phascolomyces articulosus]